jgi:recombination protein RecT
MSNTNQTNEVKQAAPKEFFEVVAAKIDNLQANGGLDVPQNYSVSNALTAAKLLLSEVTDKNGKPILEVCTKASIMTSLMKMVTQGLNPAKMQCYFIAYGDKLNFQRSYQGSIAVAKRVASVKAVNANVIYKNDVYETLIDTDTGIKKLNKHEQKLANKNDESIIGSYAIVIFNDGTSQLEEMTIQEIMKAWQQGQTKGNSPAHQNFKGEMAKKTVINRALKTLINSSTDSELMDDDEEKIGNQSDIKTKANSESLDFDDHEILDTKIAQEPEKKPEPSVATNASSNGKVATVEPGF